MCQHKGNKKEKNVFLKEELHISQNIDKQSDEDLHSSINSLLLKNFENKDQVNKEIISVESMLVSNSNPTSYVAHSDVDVENNKTPVN